MEPDLEYVGVLPPVKIDFNTKTMTVDGHKVLIKKVSIDPNSNLITVEKYRVYVPDYLFQEPWENFFGSDKPDLDEAIEDWDKNKSPVFLDRTTRKKLIYTFVIDKENNLYIKSKRAEE